MQQLVLTHHLRERGSPRVDVNQLMFSTRVDESHSQARGCRMTWGSGSVKATARRQRWSTHQLSALFFAPHSNDCSLCHSRRVGDVECEHSYR